MGGSTNGAMPNLCWFYRVIPSCVRVFSWPSSYTQTTHYYKEELTKHRNAEHLEKSLVIARLSLLGGLFLFSLVFRSITSDWGSCGAVPREASDKEFNSQPWLTPMTNDIWTSSGASHLSTRTWWSMVSKPHDLSTEWRGHRAANVERLYIIITVLQKLVLYVEFTNRLICNPIVRYSFLEVYREDIRNDGVVEMWLPKSADVGIAVYRITDNRNVVMCWPKKALSSPKTFFHESCLNCLL